MLKGATRLRHINHITYNVKNKDAALKWYQEVLGLMQIPKMVNGDHLYWLQLPSGAMVHIIENPDAPSAPSHHTARVDADTQDGERRPLRWTRSTPLTRSWGEWGLSAPRSRPGMMVRGPSISMIRTETA